MNALIAVLGLCLALPLQAEIYKCSKNGATEFSDKPCAANAETVELELSEPDADAIKTQQAITETFREESRVNQIHSLNAKNDVLEAKIEQLQQDRQTELERLRQRTYDAGDGRIATREHGLFEKMDQVDADYQQQIQQLKQEIQLNQQQLNELYR